MQRKYRPWYAAINLSGLIAMAILGGLALGALALGSEELARLLAAAAAGGALVPPVVRSGQRS